MHPLRGERERDRRGSSGRKEEKEKREGEKEGT
jgi:hypothetical protein